VTILTKFSLFFFNACTLRYYLSKPLTGLSCSLNAVFPCLKMREHLCLRYCNFFNLFYNLNCSAWERAPWRRVTEKSHLFHSKRRSGRDRESNTRATRMASSGTNRSTVHFAFPKLVIDTFNYYFFFHTMTNYGQPKVGKWMRRCGNSISVWPFRIACSCYITKSQLPCSSAKGCYCMRRQQVPELILWAETQCDIRRSIETGSFITNVLLVFAFDFD
jgi:hypothetical protein